MLRFSITLFLTSLLISSSTFAGGHLPLEVSDQSSQTSVTIASVDMDNNGFVTIHGSNAKGEMIAPASLGHTYVKAGKHKNVVVNLATAVSSGTVLYAMLHDDTGKKKVYEFGVDSTKFDPPHMHDGAPVIASFKIK